MNGPDSSDTPLRAALSEAQARVSVSKHPFFVGLTDGSMSREVFAHTQQQFRFAVEHFHRPMAVLRERIDNNDARMALGRNITDEHGNGDPSKAHGATFAEFLNALGTPPNGEPPGRPVARFNAALDDLVRTGDPVRGLAALGTIEALFATFSGTIGDAVLARGWLDREQLVHYTTHESLDVEHAESFFRPLDEMASADPTRLPAMTEGIDLGATVFGALFSELYQAAGRTP